MIDYNIKHYVLLCLVTILLSGCGTVSNVDTAPLSDNNVSDNTTSDNNVEAIEESAIVTEIPKLDVYKNDEILNTPEFLSTFDLVEVEEDTPTNLIPDEEIHDLVEPVYIKTNSILSIYNNKLQNIGYARPATYYIVSETTNYIAICDSNLDIVWVLRKDLESSLGGSISEYIYTPTEVSNNELSSITTSEDKVEQSTEGSE